MQKGIVCLLLLPLLVACGRNTVSEESAAEADIYVQTDSTLDLCIYNTDTLNPLVTSVKQNAEVLSCLYDSLFCVTTTFVPEPDLCSVYHFSRDGKTLFLRLKEDVFFSDGSLVTTEDVVQSFRRAKEAQGYYSTRLCDVLDMQAKDGNITVTFSRTAKNSLSLLDFPVLPGGGKEEEEESALLTPPCLGSGSFSLLEYQVNKALVLSPNHAHHAGKVPAFSQAVIHLADSRKTAVSMLESGRLDVLSAEEEMMPTGCQSLSYPGCGYVFLKTTLPKTLPQIRTFLAHGDFVPEYGAISLRPVHPMKQDTDSLSFEARKETGKKEAEAFGEEKKTDSSPEPLTPYTLLYCESTPHRQQVAEKIADCLTKAGIFTRAKGVYEKEYFRRMSQNHFDFLLGETTLLPDFYRVPSPLSTVGLYFESEFLWYDSGFSSLSVHTLNPYKSAYSWHPDSTG